MLWDGLQGPFKTNAGQGKGYFLCSWHCAKPFACINSSEEPLREGLLEYPFYQ